MKKAELTAQNAARQRRNRSARSLCSARHSRSIESGGIRRTPHASRGSSATGRIGGTALFAALVLGLLSLCPVVRAQDNVTIPKSRLEELERKEHELERLKGDVNKTKDENQQLKTQLQQAVTNTPVAAAPVRVSPPLATLPALQPNQVVEAVDLANYYHADKAAADQRFRNRHFTVRGEIVGFEKPLYARNYRVILQGGDRETKVICDFYPSDKFNAVFSTQHGSQLVALMGETRVPLAKVGEQVLVEGTCKGWRESAVLVSAGQLKPAVRP